MPAGRQTNNNYYFKYIILAWEPHFAWKPTFRYKSSFNLELTPSVINTDIQPYLALNQNLRKIGPGVQEFSLDIQTNIDYTIL